MYGAQVLDQVADEKSLIIAVGYMLRSSPAVVAAKQLMKEVGFIHIWNALSAFYCAATRTLDTMCTDLMKCT